MNDTIIALATPPGLGALAVIRVSGTEAINVVGSSISNPQNYFDAKRNVIKIYSFINPTTEEIIDEITAIKYFSPHSFTGENMVEIICHGSRIVIERILDTLLLKGRYAGRGEFTRRAFINGKTTLEKAESINQIINSSSLLEHKNAIYSYFDGSISLINKWKNRVESILVNCETEIEFNESVVESKNTFIKNIKKNILEFKRELQGELNKRKFIKEHSFGITLPIIGPPNAGKSTLLNLMLGYERSIVHSQEGTTRDYVSEVITINDTPVKLIDTAGIKETNNVIEKKGIKKSINFLNNNKTVLWVTAANEEIKDQEKQIDNDTILGIINKTDLSPGKEKEEYFKKKEIPYIKIKAIDLNQRDKIISFIGRELRKNYKYQNECTIIATKRQERKIEEIVAIVEKIEKYINREEIISFYCNDILRKIEEFTGKITTEEILNNIFDEFCVGK